MTQGELSSKARNQVETHGEDDIDADQRKGNLIKRINNACDDKT